MKLVDSESHIWGYREEIYNFMLVEEFVSEEFKRDGITLKCADFQQWLVASFNFEPAHIMIVHERDGEIMDEIFLMPISIQTIADKSKWGYPATVMWMRMLWKAGLARRFFQGYWQNALKGNVTGLKWGVRYLW